MLDRVRIRALREAGRQRVDCTPAGYQDSPEALKQAVRDARDTGTLKAETQPNHGNGTRGE